MARHFVQQALESNRKRLGSQRSGVADAKYWLGVSATQHGKVKEAIALHEEALKSREEQAAPFDLGSSLIAVAEARIEEGRGEEAIAFLKRALKLEPPQENQKQRLHAHAKIALAGAVWELSHRKDEPQVTALVQAARTVYEVPAISELCEQKWLARWLQKSRLGAQWESIVGPAGTAPLVESE